MGDKFHVQMPKRKKKKKQTTFVRRKFTAGQQWYVSSLHGEFCILNNSYFYSSLWLPRFQGLESFRNYVKEHGGLRYKKVFHDETTATDVNTNVDIKNRSTRTAQSWQNKTGATTAQEAVEYFIKYGVQDHELQINEQNAVIVDYVTPGFNQHGHWLNKLGTNHFETLLGDGTVLSGGPHVQQLKRDVWKSAKAIRLEAGDLLLVNNTVLQHGRLPYEYTQEGQLRQLFTLRTD